jgi:hypothetical protein
LNNTDEDRVLAAAVELTGDCGRASSWYRSERLPAFDDKTAEILVSEGRAGDVLRLIESLLAGPSG